MASATDICNLALSHLGNSAAVATIDPPDGSAEADHCARFYPMARDALLEEHDWDFATARAPLALLVETINTWGFAYALPSDAIRAIAVEPVGAASNDLIETLRDERDAGVWRPAAGDGGAFQIETDASGSKVLLTNLGGAVLRYTRRVTDSTQFSPMFVRVLSWLLAGELAGPILKGDTGASAAVRCNGMAQKLLASARESDARNRQTSRRGHLAPWLAARR